MTFDEPGPCRRSYVQTEEGTRLTKLLLYDFEDFLLIELLRETLNSSQGLATITFCTALELA